MGGRSVILKAGRTLFGRIIVMEHETNLQIADVLSILSVHYHGHWQLQKVSSVKATRLLLLVIYKRM